MIRHAVLICIIIGVAGVGVALSGEDAAEKDVPTATIEGHWTFDQDALDQSGLQRDGSFALAATITTEAAVGGGALDLRGRTGFVTVNGPILGSNAECSITYWMSNEAYNPSGLASVFADDGWECSGGCDVHVNLITADESVEFAVVGGNEHKAAVPTGNGWVHFAHVYSSITGTTETYRNGSFVASTTGPTGIQCGDGGSSTIGAWNLDGTGVMTRLFDGRIDDLRVYDGQLMPATVAALAGVIFADGFETGQTDRWAPFLCQNVTTTVVEQSDSIAAATPWQSFTADIDGDLTIVELRPNALDGISGDLTIYAGEGTDGAVLHTQAYTLPSVGGAPWHAFYLTAPVPVVAGMIYTWELTGANGIYYASEDVYPAGRAAASSQDYNMRLTINVCN